MIKYILIILLGISTFTQINIRDTVDYFTAKSSVSKEWEDRKQLLDGYDLFNINGRLIWAKYTKEANDRHKEFWGQFKEIKDRRGIVTCWLSYLSHDKKYDSCEINSVLQSIHALYTVPVREINRESFSNIIRIFFSRHVDYKINPTDKDFEDKVIDFDPKKDIKIIETNRLITIQLINSEPIDLILLAETILHRDKKNNTHYIEYLNFIKSRISKN